MTIYTSPLQATLKLQRQADYARLSDDDEKDPDLRGENVRLQLDECAIFRGQRPDWQHVDSFSDNDISASAHSNDVRPDFDKLMGLVRGSEVDIILCVEVTRLFRKPLEAEVLIDLVWSKKTSLHTIVTTRGGYYDLRTSAGRKAVRNEVNAAAGESDGISDRVRAKKAALARKGMPNGGRRPFGFEADHIAHKEAEKIIWLEGCNRLLAGESANHIFGDWNERGIPTAESKKWYKPTFINMYKRVRYRAFDESGRGIREHNGALYKAIWEGFIDHETSARLDAVLRANEQMDEQRGRPRKYVLSGFAFCGECNRKLGGMIRRDRPSQPKKPRYACRPYDALRRKTGCAKVSRLAEPLEDFVADAVLYRLDSVDFAQVFAEDEQDSIQLKTALDALHTHKQRLDTLVDDYYGANPDGLTREQFLRGKTASEAELERLGREVEKLSSKRAVVGVPIGQTIRDAWGKNTDLGWRRQVIGLIVNKVIVHSGGGKPMYKGRWKFDPNQIEIIWKI